MDILNTPLTKHCEIYRRNRVSEIIDKVGVGQICKKIYRSNFGIPARNVYICITDTGVTIIKDETETKIITMYITTYRELVSVYGGEKRIPKFLHSKVDRNQSKFTKHGKTIWRN